MGGQDVYTSKIIKCLCHQQLQEKGLSCSGSQTMESPSLPDAFIMTMQALVQVHPPSFNINSINAPVTYIVIYLCFSFSVFLLFHYADFNALLQANTI